MIKLIKKLSGANSIKGASVILIITLLLSNILGLIRDHFLAQKIPTNMLDVYYASFRIPDLIFNLLILGAITASFIPVFTSFLARDKKEDAFKIANSFLNLSLLAIIIACGLLFIFMPQLVPVVVPDFDQEKQELTIQISRLLLLSPVFFAISQTFGSILNSFKHFFVYSLAPIVYNLLIILGTIFLSDKLGVYGVVYGVLVGAFMHMFIQFLQLRKIGYKYRFSFDYKNKNVREIFYLMIPRAIGLGANQLMLLAYTAIASSLTAGSIAVFSLADNIQTMPIVVFGISLATAFFPTLAENANLKKFGQMSEDIMKAIKAIAFSLFPATIAIILLRAQVVRLILGSGYFGWDDTMATFDALAWFSISLFAQGIIPVLARSFYAIHDTKTPTYISVLSVVTGIVSALALAPVMSVSGLALSFSIASIFNALGLYFILRNKISEIKKLELGLINYFGKIFLSSLAMGALIQILKIFISKLVDMNSFLGILIQTSISLTLGITVYLIITNLLGCKELTIVINLIKRVIYKDKNSTINYEK